MLKIVPDDAMRDDLASPLDELVVEGARRMLMAGLEAEVADYVECRQGLLDEAGHRLVVRNGRAAERNLMTGAGALKVQAPRVNDRSEGRRFSSYILPRYARRSVRFWTLAVSCQETVSDDSDANGMAPKGEKPLFSWPQSRPIPPY